MDLEIKKLEERLTKKDLPTSLRLSLEEKLKILKGNKTIMK